MLSEHSHAKDSHKFWNECETFLIRFSNKMKLMSNYLLQVLNRIGFNRSKDYCGSKIINYVEQFLERNDACQRQLQSLTAYRVIFDRLSCNSR